MHSRSHLPLLRQEESAEIARKLRSRMTDAEIRFWHQVRRGGAKGLRFRKQVPLGPYIVDFLCEPRRLVVELDGGQHATRTEQDMERTRWLEARGYRVVRYWNNDVLSNLEGVMEDLLGKI